MAKIRTREAQSHAEHSQYTQATPWAQHHESLKTQASGAGRPPRRPPRTSQAAMYQDSTANKQPWINPERYADEGWYHR